MLRKLMTGLYLLFIFLVSASTAIAQGDNSIMIINQYYHNWTGGVEDVYIEGDLAYLACSNDDGLRIINISDLNAVYDLGQYPVTWALSITVAGDYAYLGTRSEGFYIIDISEPIDPVEVSHVGGFYQVYEIEVDGNTAFVCHGDGVSIYDISDITNPTELWVTPDVDEACAIEIRNNTAYVGSNYPGLIVMDITDISSPQVLYTYQPSGYNFVNGLDIKGNYAYLASGWNGFEVFDLTTHEVVASIDSLVWAFRLEVEGDYAYMTYGDPDCPFAVIDITDPTSPRTMGIYYPPEDLINFMIVEDQAYMADYAHGLRVVDVSLPEEPVETHVYSRYGLDMDVVVKGDYAYIKEDVKFKIIDISDMSNPFETGYYEFDWGYNDIHIVGDIAYLSKCNYDCLYSFDISDPYNPSVISTYRDESNDVHYRMKLYGNYAYIVENSGLEIVDISDPENMVYAGHYDEYIGNSQFEIYDHYLFLCSSSNQGNTSVFDLADPTSPQYITGYDLSWGYYDLCALDGYLYVIESQDMWVFDISNLDQWQPIANLSIFDDGRYLTDIETDGVNIYLTDAINGLTVCDVSDPYNPFKLGQENTPGSAEGLYARDGIVFIADQSNLGFYDCTGITGIEDDIRALPESFTLISNYPNPFNASTNILFELPTQANVQLDIYDILGRKVTSLADRQFEAGSHSISWNGTSFTGQSVASGRYYIKAVSDGRVESLPVMLLK